MGDMKAENTWNSCTYPKTDHKFHMTLLPCGADIYSHTGSSFFYEKTEKKLHQLLLVPSSILFLCTQPSTKADGYLEAVGSQEAPEQGVK
jgi:hypothetical protein